MSQTKQKSIKINAILNVLTQASSVIFPLILYPYISRRLGSENFGKYNFAYVFVQYFMILEALGIPTYVVREASRIRDDKQKVEKLVSELFTINMISALASMLLMTAMTLSIGKINEYKDLIFILGFIVLSEALSRDWINTIYEDYLYRSLRYILSKVLCIVLVLILIHHPEDVNKYAVITLITEAGAFLLNIFYCRRYVPYRLTLKPNFKQHLKPIFLLFFTSVAVKIYVQSDITILGIIRNDKEVGVYTLASKIYSVIKAVLNAMIFVAIPRISYYMGEKNEEGYSNLISNVKNALFTLIFPCIIGSACLSHEIMMILGGEEYAGGERALQILSVAILFAVMACYYSQAIMIPNREEKKFFIYTSVSALVNIVLNIVLIPFLGMNGAAITTVVAEAIIMTTSYRASRKYIYRKDNVKVLPIILGCGYVLGICLAIKLLDLGSVLTVILSVVAAVPGYFIILLIGKNELVVNGLNSVKQKLKRKHD